jgi:hypothetical protein
VAVSSTGDVAYPLFRPGSAGTPPSPPSGGGGGGGGSVDAAGPSPIPSEEFAVRDATDLLPTSLFPSLLAATLHPATSDIGRLGYFYRCLRVCP